MNKDPQDFEPVDEPDLAIWPGPKCVGCGDRITGERFWIPAAEKCDKPYHPACADCYANYVKKKFGTGNTNPDDIQIA